MLVKMKDNFLDKVAWQEFSHREGIDFTIPVKVKQTKDKIYYVLKGYLLPKSVFDVVVEDRPLEDYL